jgi:hypothetical protein
VPVLEVLDDWTHSLVAEFDAIHLRCSLAERAKPRRPCPAPHRSTAVAAASCFSRRTQSRRSFIVPHYHGSGDLRSCSGDGRSESSAV